MTAHALPYFHAVQDGYLYRVYVATSDLICVRLGKGFLPKTADSRFAIGINWVAVFCVGLGILAGAVAGAFIGASVFGTVFGGGHAYQTLFGLAVGGVIGVVSGAGAGWNAVYILEKVRNPNAAPDEVATFEKSVSEMDAYLCKCDLAEIRSYVSEKRCGYTVVAKKVGAKIARIGKWKRFFFGKPVPALVIEHPSKGKLILAFRKRSDIVIGLYELEQLLGDKLEVALDMGDYEKALKKYRKMREA